MTKKKESHDMTGSYIFLVAIIGIVAAVGFVGLMFSGGTPGSALRTLAESESLSAETESLPGPGIYRCSDSDGRNAFQVPGHVYYKNLNYYDYCGGIDGNTNYDWYCRDALEPAIQAKVVGDIPSAYPSKTSINCQQYGMNYACINNSNGSYCGYVGPEQSCSDNDPYNHPNYFGSVYGYDENGTYYSNPDYCWTSYVYQWECEGDIPVLAGWDNCTYGCTNGTCNDQPDSYCGDGNCDPDEYYGNCPVDCPDASAPYVRANSYYVDVIKAVGGDCYATEPQSGLTYLKGELKNPYGVVKDSKYVNCYGEGTCNIPALISFDLVSGMWELKCESQNGAELTAYGYNYTYVDANETAETCFDSDPGNDAYMYGFVNGTNQTGQYYYYGDFCNGNQVGQYYCNGNHASFFGYASCAYGCSNGECQAQSGQPDLIVYNVNYTNSTWNGSAYVRGLLVTVMNVGSAPTSGSSWVYSRINISGAPYAEYLYVPPLDYQTGYNTAVKLHTISVYPGYGYKDYFAKADHYDTVIESNENNNYYWNSIYTYP